MSSPSCNGPHHKKSLASRVSRTYEFIMRAIFEDQDSGAASWASLAAAAFLVLMIACLMAFFL
jgi:hypothetical protein